MKRALLLALTSASILAAEAQTPVAGPDGTPQTMPSLQLVWIERSGTTNIAGAPGPYLGLEIAPDGKRVAVHRHENAGGDIWVVEPDGKQTRITSEPARDNVSPVWSPDGKHIAYAAQRDEQWEIYRKASNGSGKEELLFASAAVKAPVAWTPDGKRLIFYALSPETKGDLWILSLDGSPKPEPLIATDANEWNAQISPDGKWIAYTSDAAGGRDAVYAQAFPNGGPQFRVSPAMQGGAAWPRWSKDGEELFYRADPETWDGKSITVSSTVFAIPISAKRNVLSTGKPTPIHKVYALTIHHFGGGTYHSYDVTSDGKRILNFLPPAPPPKTQQIAAK